MVVVLLWARLLKVNLRHDLKPNHANHAPCTPSRLLGLTANPMQPLSFLKRNSSLLIGGQTVRVLIRAIGFISKWLASEEWRSGSRIPVRLDPQRVCLFTERLDRTQDDDIFN